MIAYVIRRIFVLIPTLLGVSILVFLMLHLTPGDPAELLMGERASEEALQEIREHLGLNKPLHQQYWLFLKQ
ncbi:MAG: peptide ABC transporter permease, partial [Desulfobacterales bacterium]